MNDKPVYRYSWQAREWQRLCMVLPNGLPLLAFYDTTGRYTYSEQKLSAELEVAKLNGAQITQH